MLKHWFTQFIVYYRNIFPITTTSQNNNNNKSHPSRLPFPYFIISLPIFITSDNPPCKRHCNPPVGIPNKPRRAHVTTHTTSPKAWPLCSSSCFSTYTPPTPSLPYARVLCASPRPTQTHTHPSHNLISSIRHLHPFPTYYPPTHTNKTPHLYNTPKPAKEDTPSSCFHLQSCGEIVWLIVSCIYHHIADLSLLYHVPNKPPHICSPAPPFSFFFSFPLDWDPSISACPCSLWCFQ